MSSLRFDPFRDLDRWANEVMGSARTPRLMPLDAYKEGESYVLRFDLPGVQESSLQVTAENNTLTVRAERRPERGDGVQYLVAERPTGVYQRQVMPNPPTPTGASPRTPDPPPGRRRSRPPIQGPLPVPPPPGAGPRAGGNAMHDAAPRALDDAYTMGTAADLIGVSPAFLRSLGAHGLIAPNRPGGGHRRYCRRDLTLASRVRDITTAGRSYPVTDLDL